MSLHNHSKRNLSSGALALGIFLIAQSPPNAYANSSTETFIEVQVLEALSNWPDAGQPVDRGMIADQLTRFVDLERIAEFTLGKYGKRYSASELQDYKATFRDFACDYVYNILSAHHGSQVHVSSSHERRANDVIVSTDIISPSGKTLRLNWRLFVQGNDIWVRDVAISDQGNDIWLALELRAQFVAVLDRNFGNPAALNRYLQSQMKSAS